VLPRFFRARIRFENGIVFLGVSVGSVVLSSVIQELVISVGLTKTFRVLAGLELLLVLCGLAIRLIPWTPELDQPKFNNRRRKTSFGSVFKNKGFVTLVGSLCLFMPAYLVPYVHLVS